MLQESVISALGETNLPKGACTSSEVAIMTSCRSMVVSDTVRDVRENDVDDEFPKAAIVSGLNACCVDGTATYVSNLPIEASLRCASDVIAEIVVCRIGH